MASVRQAEPEIQPVYDPTRGEAWRKAWREGFLPQLPRKGLEALKKALETDDQGLIQGATTSPPPLVYARDMDVTGACAVTFCGCFGLDLMTVAEAEEFFARCCFRADERLGEAAACRYFLNVWDETPRPEMFRLMLEEVKFNLEMLPAA